MLLCALFSNVRANALIVTGDALVYWLPPFWFFGIYETWIGHNNLIFHALTNMAYKAAAISCFVSIICSVLSYRLYQAHFTAVAIPDHNYGVHVHLRYCKSD